MASFAPQSPNRRGGRDRRAEADGRIADDLASSMTRGEIELLFQPQFAADGGLAGAEALARWRHPQRGLIGGEELFVLARRAGRVADVSRHLAGRALGAAAAWPTGLRLSLNITAADLATADFAEHIEALLRVTAVAPERLTLEITEQSLVLELERTTELLMRLANRGVHVALDDFGAGFCNFGYLKRLPLHALKLDRSMIEGVVDDPRDLAVLRGIVAMARALGLEVVAEGVESEAQRRAVVAEGCTAWQGFLGAAPMTEADFLRLAAG